MWTQPFLAPYGVDVPIRVVREQIVMISPPGVELGPVPVFSDLVSLQYVRPEVGGDVLFGNSDLSDVLTADPPDDYLNRATEDFIDLTVDKVGTRFPRLHRCGDHLELRRVLRRHTGLEPGHLGRRSRRIVRGGRVQRPRIQDRTGGRPVGRGPSCRRPQQRPTDPPETDFRLSRFAEGELLKSPYPYAGAGQMR